MASRETLEPKTNGESQDDDEAHKQANNVAKTGESHVETEFNESQPAALRRATDLTGFALRFLSNASNETLGACFIGLGATTYLVLGRVGLILIGVVGGVALQAAWDHDATDKDNQDIQSQRVRKTREKGLEIVSRLLDLREKATNAREKDENSVTIHADRKELEFDGFQSDVRVALESFTDAVIRDYVRWWYTPILPKDDLFPAACRQTLTGFILKVSNKLSHKRPADTFLEFLTNSSSIVIVFLSELSTALKQSPGTDCPEAIRQHILGNPESSLANVLDKEQQEKKLKGIADDVLQSFLDATAYTCEPVKIFLQQVLASLVLDGTVISCSRPEFINEWIIYALEDEQKSELVKAIDAGVSGATANGAAAKEVTATAAIADVEGDSGTKREHKRTVSRAEEAMEEAMQEAKRLSALIATEDDKRYRLSEVGDSSGALVSESATSKPTNPPSNTDQAPHHFATPEKEDVTATSAPSTDLTQSFTTFDQIISSRPSALQSDILQNAQAAPMTLHYASVSIFDDAVPGEKTTIKAKPTVEYLLQIEPAISQYPGWMIARKYPDFETMHEVLRRIAVISGVTAFTQRNPVLPTWKNKTKSTLRIELERYLRDALSFDRLAESEGMKRFLEKDQGLKESPGNGNKGGFGFPSPAAFETMGKGMLDVLASAPKGVAGGGKAVVGGVAGVFGGKGSKKQSSPLRPIKSDNASATSLERADIEHHPNLLRESHEQPYLSASGESQSGPDQPPADKNGAQTGTKILSGLSEDHSKDTPAQSFITQEIEFNLPPPPSEIGDDYETISSSPKLSLDDSTILRTPPSTLQSSRVSLPSDATPTPKPPRKVESSPLSSEETSVAVELFFATINELYSLSSAWTLRLTLLNAAKSFLLRPGNPNLEAIRQLLQSTLIDSQSTDSAIATHIRKLRENSLPTQEELDAWPPPPNDEEKEQLRKKARKLLVEKGMPAALTSVMGAAASGEALGKVFDCLQVSEVARGLVFALVLQAVRTVTH